MKTVKKKRRYRIMLLFCIAVMLLFAATAVSAYFTDRIQTQTAKLHTGALRFSYPQKIRRQAAFGVNGAENEKDAAWQGYQKTATGNNAQPDTAMPEYGIIADFSALEQRQEPYQEGDSIPLHFKVYLSGDAAAYVVPKLNIRVANQKPEDHFLLYEGTGSGAEGGGLQFDGAAGSGTYYGAAQTMTPGTEQSFDYRISLDRLSSDSKIAFDLDFSVAAVQERNNTITGKSPQIIYEAIEAVYEKTAEEKREEAVESDVKSKKNQTDNLIGFTDICGLNRAIGADGKLLSAASSRQIFVELKPQITAGNPKIQKLSWYRSGKEGIQRIKADADGKVQMLLSGAAAADSFYYEVQNEAGIQVSPYYTIQIEKDAIRCRKHSFTPDFQNRPGNKMAQAEEVET